MPPKKREPKPKAPRCNLVIVPIHLVGGGLLSDDIEAQIRFVNALLNLAAAHGITPASLAARAGEGE
ncbi:hypothetical protein [Deinococcus sp. QL22]|uniref:hypothetical protein n=1 Tax=Deinococcus sp. QL22 TaxID=2939437 RepID=UPI00201787BB|nr:hypothetical protein [Deinococcus sp. QL22]UQN10837.1 hypothetical protein M1R55_31590 [Deinococcus sp. QL22]